MHDFPWILLVVGIILTVVTLVGHGIWVLLATLFGGGRQPDASRGRKCPFCGEYTSALALRCDWCGRMVGDWLTAEIADLEAVERQLRRFRESGAMKPEVAARLLARVRDYRQQLLKPPTPVKPIEPIAATAVVAEIVPEPIATKKIVAKPPPAEHLVAKLQALPPVVARPQDIPPQPPAPPKESWAEVLAGFMEERNIRWAELVGVLVGGLLIVGSSLALVVSFWDTLQETYLKFLIFVGYSSAVFGVGLFAFHRWKLASTGRGLLAIATLLVPLNFVAMASLSPESWGWQTAATELGSLGIFAWLSFLAAGVLLTGRRWPLVLAVLGNSALVLLAARLLGRQSSEAMLLAADCVPAVLLAVAMAGQSVGLRRRRLQAADAGSMFSLLGIAAFASAVGVGILVTKGGEFLDLRISLYCLTPSLALAAWPILASGLRIMRGMAREESLEAFRTAGTTVALVGVALQLAALGLCWPQPLGLAVVGLVNAVGLIFIALRHRFPIAHAGAMVCLALAYLAGFHLLTDAGLRHLQFGSLVIHDAGLGAQMLHLFFSARSATSLCGLFLVFAGIAAWFAAGGSSRHAVAYGLGCGVTAAAAVTAITVIAITGTHADALYAAALYGFYGVACVLISTRWQRATFSYVGWNLLAAAPFWALNLPLFAVWQDTAALAGCLFWLAAIWLLLAWLHRNRDLLRAGQCVFTAAAGVAATAWLQTQPWVLQLPADLLDPRSLQTYGIALGLLSLLWILARIAFRTSPAAERLLRADEPTVDWMVRHAVIWLQTLLAVAFVITGIGQELHPNVFDATVTTSFATAGGPASWILLGVLATVLIASLWERWQSAELIGVLLLAATASCLAAGQFADQVAVASALRWGLAACFLVCSVFIWRRRRLLQWSQAATTSVALDAHGPEIARTTLLMLTAGPVVVVTSLAAALQFASIAPGGPAAGSFFDRLGPNLSYLVPLALVIAGLVGYALRESSAGYAFSAGLVAEMGVTLGYALSIVTDPAREFATKESVILIQLATITAAAWAIAWMAAQNGSTCGVKTRPAANARAAASLLPRSPRCLWTCS